MATQNVSKSSPALIAITWLIVVAPTLWGLTYTVQNALKLFKAPPAVVVPANPAQANH